MGWRRVTVYIACASACALGGNSQPQVADCSGLRFEVASVKPAPQSRDRRATGRFGLSPGGERYEAINITPVILILEAFQIYTEQVVGIPDWMTRERWDVIGKPERPASPREMHCVLQNLLVDRFHLQFHLVAGCKEILRQRPGRKVRFRTKGRRQVQEVELSAAPSGLLTCYGDANGSRRRLCSTPRHCSNPSRMLQTWLRWSAPPGPLKSINDE